MVVTAERAQVLRHLQLLPLGRSQMPFWHFAGSEAHLEVPLPSPCQVATLIAVEYGVSGSRLYHRFMHNKHLIRVRKKLWKLQVESVRFIYELAIWEFTYL